MKNVEEISSEVVDTALPTSVIPNGLEHINHYMQDGYFVACKALLDPHSGRVNCEVHDR